MPDGIASGLQEKRMEQETTNNSSKSKLNIRILIFVAVFILTIGVLVLFAVKKPKVLFPAMFQEKKQILFLGDSNIAYDFSEKDIPQMLSEKMDVVAYNAAVGGTCAHHKNEPYPMESFYTMLDLANITKMMETGDFTCVLRDKDMLDQGGDIRDKMMVLQHLDYKAMDYVIIHYGINDYMAAAPLEGKHANDDTSYAGSLRSSVIRLHKLCPDATVIISSIPFCWGYDKTNDEYISGLEYDYGCGTIDRYFEASKEVASEFGYVYFLDNLTDCVENTEVEESPYHQDRVHYSQEGRELYVERLSNLLRELDRNEES